MTNGKRPSFRGIYFIGLAATTIGIGVIIFLNLATPLEYMHGQLTAPDQIKALHLGRQLRGIFNLAFLLLLSCPPLLFLIRHFLSPLSEYCNLLRVGQESEDFLEEARKIVDEFVLHYNPKRLHRSIGYVTPKDNLEGREQQIFAQRDHKLHEAREILRNRRRGLKQIVKEQLNLTDNGEACNFI